jgi:hypothetical protein
VQDLKTDPARTVRDCPIVKEVAVRRCIASELLQHRDESGLRGVKLGLEIIFRQFRTRRVVGRLLQLDPFDFGEDARGD